MAHIVLVHGIAQEQLSADGLENAWMPALAGGVRNAGHPDLADRLWPIRPTDRLTRMAYYGNLFLTADQQGDTTTFTKEQDTLADEIAAEWLTNALELLTQWGELGSRVATCRLVRRCGDREEARPATVAGR